MNKTISVVLGSYNRKSCLKVDIKSIQFDLEKDKVSYEIIVIDGGSNDGSINWLVKQKNILSIIQHNQVTRKDQYFKKKSWGYTRRRVEICNSR